MNSNRPALGPARSLLAPNRKRLWVPGWNREGGERDEDDAGSDGGATRREEGGQSEDDACGFGRSADSDLQAAV